MTQTPEPIGPPPNPRQSEAVLAITSRMMHTDGVDIGWMTADVARSLIAAFTAGQTQVMMQLLRRGLPREQAEQSAEAQMPLVAFELGLKVGAELESTRAFREIVGDANFDFGAGPDGQDG